MLDPLPRIGAVVIGRNEGARLIACLDSLIGKVDHIVYVDSGSTDGSVNAARDRGVEVVLLDTTLRFTAARARNAGLSQLARLPEEERPDLIQMIDGDCILDPNWIETAARYLMERPDLALVFGRRREIHPEASIYNRLIDREWDTPIGEAQYCGGDIMIRLQAVIDTGGYRDEFIAGEEPELCLRLKRRGWGIWRLDAEMTRHDAAITRFGQWWDRSRRAGYAFAQGAAVYGQDPERHWVVEHRRAILWGAVIPVAILLLALVIHPYALWLLLIYPAQMIRLSLKFGVAGGVFSVIGKFAEVLGVIRYWRNRFGGVSPMIIEYK